MRGCGMQAKVHALNSLQAKATMKSKTVQAAVAKARAVRSSRHATAIAAAKPQPPAAGPKSTGSTATAAPARKPAQTAKSAAAAARAQAKAKGVGTVVGKQLRGSNDKLKKVLLPKKVRHAAFMCVLSYGLAPWPAFGCAWCKGCTHWRPGQWMQRQRELQQNADKVHKKGLSGPY